MNGKLPLVVLTGPTAVGKTSLSIRLAHEISAEIISADSMQVYKRMDIGTAKIKKEEMDGITHHMIDILEPREDFNVTMFVSMASELVKNITDRGNIPLITGGTGFYIQALLKNVMFTEEKEDSSIRRELMEYAAANGTEALHDMLGMTDPEYAAQVHPNNIKRVIRAIEYYRQTGDKFSEHNKREALRESPYNYAYFVLNDRRSHIYDRINKRVDIMMQDGLVNEVASLLEEGCTTDMVSMQGLGYKEIIEYIQGKCTLDEAVDNIKQSTRHFAKRQLTWFRREPDVTMLDISQYGSREKVYEKMLEILKEREITK